MGITDACLNLFHHCLWIALAVALVRQFLAPRSLTAFLWCGLAVGGTCGVVSACLDWLSAEQLLRLELMLLPILLLLPLFARHLQRSRPGPDREGDRLAAGAWLDGLAVLILTGLPLGVWAGQVARRVQLVWNLRESTFESVSWVEALSALGLIVVVALCLMFRRTLSRILSFSGLVLPIISSRLLLHQDLIVPLQSMITRIVHDVTHWVDLLLLIPHHHLVGQETWDAFAFLLNWQVNLGMLFTLLLLLALIYTVEHFRSSGPSYTGEETPAARRKIRAAFLKARRLRAVPLAIGMLLLLVAADLAQGLYVDVYNPTPQPVTVEGDDITLPLQTPRRDLQDGRLHKFVTEHEGRRIIFLVIRKPDGTIATTVDDCLLCPPRGYAQKGRDLFCLYCQTVIPIETVGREGGCNPVPFPSRVQGGELLLQVSDLAEAHLLGDPEPKGGEGR